MQKATIFLACVFIVVLSGCGKTTRLIKDPEPYQIAKPIASASDERLVATLDWVIVRLGPGAWAKNADWDEFLLRFENLSDSPLKIMSVTVFDSFDTRIETRPNRKQLVEGSKETKRRYADSDIKIMAGWGAGTIAVTGLVAGVGGAALVVSNLAIFGPMSTTAGAAVAGGAVLVLAAPIVMLHGLGRHSRSKKVGKEIIRRQTVLPIEIPPSQELPVDLFFPLTPSPTHLEVIYTDTETEYRLIIDTQEALNGLHLVPEKK